MKKKKKSEPLTRAKTVKLLTKRKNEESSVAPFPWKKPSPKKKSGNVKNNPQAEKWIWNNAPLERVLIFLPHNRSQAGAESD